ncbi:MAG: peptidoglycan D,D-transpeptidase FtsI family protein [Angustibacter sp.]
MTTSATGRNRSRTASRRPTTRSAVSRSAVSRSAVTRRAVPANRRLAADRDARRRIGIPQRRARAMFVAACVVLSLFAAQLLRLQALDASAMAREALGGRLTTAAVPAVRGQLLDRSGVVFATSLERYHITVDQKVVPEYYRYVEDPRTSRSVRQRLGVAGAARGLATALGMDEGEVRRRITGTKRFVYLAKNVTPDVWHQVRSLRIGAVHAERVTQRSYPADGVAAPVIGFVGQAGTALGGLELSLDEQLAGRAGTRTFQRDPSGRSIATTDVAEQPAVPGQDIQLTLDRDLQWRAEQLLADQVRRTGALSGTVVVMSVRTGEVLALANAPSFDPNAPGDADSGDLANRALSEVYEPGSTSKVMTAAAVLQERVVRPSTPFTVSDQIGRAGTVFHDSHPHPTQRLTFAGVLAQSSNVGTILAGERLSPQQMDGYLRRFGIGQPTGLSFPGESRGILAPSKQWSGSQRYTILFGQGLSVNAVQATGVFQTIANGGVRVQPTLVRGSVGPGGQLQPAAPGRRTRVVDARTARELRTMLEGAVSDEGTAPQARVPGYRVAGKTGTAERFDPDCGCYRGYTASFIGMAPADAPQLVVAVTLQRPVRGYYGGAVAAPVFRQVMQYALQKMQVPPTGTRVPTIKLTPG